MNHPSKQTYLTARRESWKLNAVAGLVALSGFITISSILFALLRFHRAVIVSTDAHLTLLAGLSLIYLATLLNRGKRTAWLVSLPIYAYLVARNIRHFGFDFPHDFDPTLPTLLNLAIPGVTLIILIYNRRLFNVRSEIRNFTTALQRSVIVILVAFVYGVAGFSLLDERDFHQEIKPMSAAHYTVDQFNITTVKGITPYTKRAHVFVDSLAAISLGALFYTGVSLFSPIRFRLSHHQQDYEDVKTLLQRHSTTSEDFFMLWPMDKSYFFNAQRSAVVAYKAASGVALIVGDPVGPKDEVESLLMEFIGLCRVNDWQAAFIHTEAKNLDLYKKLGFEVQKIGEEAIVDVPHFVNNVSTNKDFRHISNKFDKLGYSTQILEPPHTELTLQRLQSISSDWLDGPGRDERGFMMGYFIPEYLQQCYLVVAKDGSGEIQAFINQVPSPTSSEVNFDFLRHSKASPGNINDFLMLNFISYLHQQNIPRLNMGLSPLSGLADAKDSASRVLNGFLNFAYANGNRFYSFQGLKRFKAKYEPRWEDRYIIYRGGIRGFSKTINGLMRAMRVHSPRYRH